MAASRVARRKAKSVETAMTAKTAGDRHTGKSPPASSNGAVGAVVDSAVHPGRMVDGDVELFVVRFSHADLTAASEELAAETANN